MLKDGTTELRAMEPEDLELVLALENDTNLWHWGNSNVPYSRYIIRQYLEQNNNDIYADGQLRLVICEDGKAVGLIDLINFDPRNSRAEVGIVLLPEYQGRGIGTRALAMQCRYAKEFLRIHQLYAFVSERNASACRLFCKAGYKEASLLSDWLALGDAYVGAYMYVL